MSYSLRNYPADTWPAMTEIAHRQARVAEDVARARQGGNQAASLWRRTWLQVIARRAADHTRPDTAAALGRAQPAPHHS
jgi:hypothetical protein